MFELVFGRAVVQTIYEKYGGFKTMSGIVMSFYEMVLESDEIGDYFEDIDMPRLADHQIKFVSTFVGGPASFSDDRIEAVHRRVGISHSDFDAMAALFGQALSMHGMSDEDVDAALAAVEGKRGIIVARNAV